MSRAGPSQFCNFAFFLILLACVWRGFGDNPAGLGWILSAEQAFRVRFLLVSDRMEGMLPPAKCSKVNQHKPPDQEHLMPDLHTRAVSSTDSSDLRLAIRDAINGGIAKIAQIQNDEDLPAAEPRFGDALDFDRSRKSQCNFEAPPSATDQYESDPRISMQVGGNAQCAASTGRTRESV